MTPASPRKTSEPQWLTNALDYYWIHDVLQIYVGLSIWLIQWDGRNRLEWLEMTPQSNSRLSPVHFEKFFRKEGQRDAYYFQSLKALERTKTFLLGHHGGFHELFLPVQLQGKKRAALYANSFLREPAQLGELKENWRKLSGREADGFDPDFLKYVRMALALPVLDGALLKGVREFLQTYAGFLTGRRTASGLWEKVDGLRRKVFALRLPNTAWVEEALGLEKFIPAPWNWYAEPQLAPWMNEELGITRIPTVVIAAMPLKQGLENPDPAETLVKNDAIQRECFQFAKSLPQTVAGRLGDYGAVFLTSPGPGKSEAQTRLEIRDRAEKIRDFIHKKSGARAVAGIGRAVAPALGESLASSYREAVLALHLCVQTEKPLLFYAENLDGGKGGVYARLHSAEQGLLQAFGRNSAEDIKLASDRYVREVLEFGGRETAVVRGQFLSVLSQALDKVGLKSVLNPSDTERFAAAFSEKMEEAGSIYRLIEVLKETLQALAGFSSKPLEGAKTLRLEATLKHLAAHCQEPLRLPEVAKQTGFSVPVFCRVFKKATGQSFVAYLNRLRVERAKNLLRTGGLNVLQVGQACGFQTPHHFIRNFKRVTGLTPGDYRKK